MPVLLHPAPPARPSAAMRTLSSPSCRTTPPPRGPPPPAADKMCRDVVSAPKDRPPVSGAATVRFLGADGAAIEVECAKVRAAVMIVVERERERGRARLEVREFGAG